MIHIANRLFMNERYPINIEESNQLILIENIDAFQSEGLIRIRGNNNAILIRNLWLSSNSTDDNLKQIAITDDVLSPPTNKVIIESIHGIEGAGSYIFLQNCKNYFISNVKIINYGKIDEVDLNTGHSYAIKIDNYKFQSQLGIIENLSMFDTNRISTLGGNRWESSRFNAVWFEDGVRENILRNSTLDCNVKTYSDPETSYHDAGDNNQVINCEFIGLSQQIDREVTNI